jgi:hypothetical protein
MIDYYPPARAAHNFVYVYEGRVNKLWLNDETLVVTTFTRMSLLSFRKHRIMDCELNFSRSTPSNVVKTCRLIITSSEYRSSLKVP